MYFIIFIHFLLLQRLTELYISKRNEKWLLSQGAIEYGREHYPYIVALHTLFIISLIAEYYLTGGPADKLYCFVIVYIVACF